MWVIVTLNHRLKRESETIFSGPRPEMYVQDLRDSGRFRLGHKQKRSTHW